MKNLTELGLDIIKCENKNGTDAIKTIHYQVNNIIMKNKYRLQSEKSAKRILDFLIANGVELNNLQVPQSAEAKKQEILKKLKSYCLILKRYMISKDTFESQGGVQKIVNYMVGSYLNQKDEKYNNVESILEYLQDMKNVAEDYDFNGVNTTKFKQLNEEILNDLTARYRINII